MSMVQSFVRFYRTRVQQYYRNQWANQWKSRKIIYNWLDRTAENDALLESKKKFFVLGSGRSGTQMLSGLLNLDHSVLVLHEPAFFEDRVTRNTVRYGKLNVREYLIGFRKHLIAHRIRKSEQVKTYGEVTGTLRYHAAGIKEVFPDAKMLILTRDGRDVVRSIMQHDFYTETSVKDGDTSPLFGKQYFNTWEGMSRFEKVCWLWADSYESLLRLIPETKIIYFEKIIEDFDYCNNQVFSFLDIQISHEQWQKYLSKKSINAINHHKFSHWKDWSQKNRDDFDRICGPVMNRLGYKYKW